jgi:hypothetical protein
VARELKQIAIKSDDEAVVNEPESILALDEEDKMSIGRSGKLFGCQNPIDIEKRTIVH